MMGRVMDDDPEVAGAVLAGCANSQPLSTGFAAPAQAAEPDRDPSKKTLASKVLSAIALERVTSSQPPWRM